MNVEDIIHCVVLTINSCHFQPCVTPRLFTCVILLLQHKGHTTEQVSPIIPLLRSFVSAEVASLKDLDTTKKIRRKKLNFCSFDFSSTINPTDTAVESNVIIESCISKLHGIIQEIDKLSAKTDCVQTIGAFVNALICIENESQTLSYAQCSKVSVCNFFRYLLFGSCFPHLTEQNYRIGYAFFMASGEISQSFNSIS